MGLIDHERHAAEPTRRQLITGGVVAGIATMSLPASGRAASVGGAGGEQPSYPGALQINTTANQLTVNGITYRAGGWWWRQLAPAGQEGWYFEISKANWDLPLADAGKSGPPFTYEYQLSPNLGRTWHTLTWTPHSEYPYWFGFISHSVIANLEASDPRPADSDSPFYHTVGGRNYLINMLMRARLNTTVIDQSSPFMVE